ncbi:GTP-binding protein RHO3 [Penicillium malachiteum]|uniref:GTP-binding protein RHO3 n=1 Tax=Penicillium malachiteum TaxID=1324776 RepID=UPI0025471DCA|nr:GTP-binding protein RHO3 [Penicillium malachiteum]KAJ5715790.1 GTP-binding protein RHO3 [Penicillium malachiteum]
MELCGRQKVVQRKMVLLGDGACGKTSALNVFTRGCAIPPQPSNPSLKSLPAIPNQLANFGLYDHLGTDSSQLSKNYVHDIFVDNVHMELSLWDTAGQEEFDRLRALSYEDTHVLMLCFSVDSSDSFENVGSKWIAEISENCPNVRVVLTALKCDLRKDDEMNDNPNAITFDQGLAKAKEIGAVKYLECSAVQNRGIRESFYEAAKVALEVKPTGGSGSAGCVML